MQTKWRESSSENQEFLAQLQVYKGTQEELTSELSDFKEKYQEVVDLLRDSQNELKNLNKKSYPGLELHGISETNENSSNNLTETKSCLKSEIYSSIYGGKKSCSDSRQGLTSTPIEISRGWKNISSLPTHSMARANLNESKKVLTNTIAASNIPRRTRISIN